MPTPAEIRRASLLAANAYVLSRIWAFEDDTANALRYDVERAYSELFNTLAILFSTYVSGTNWSASSPAYRVITDSFNAAITVVMQGLEQQVVQRAFDAAIAAQQGSYYGSAWALTNGIRATTTTLASEGVATVMVSNALASNATLIVKPIPIEAIRAAILAPYKGSTFLDRYANARDEFVSLIKKSIVESQIKGESMNQAAKRLRDALGLNRQSPGGYLNRVEMITRTEIIRSSNAGTEAIYRANRDVLSGVEYKATNDERTCRICGGYDGKRYKWGEAKPDIPVHPFCRCDYLPVLIDQDLEQLIVGPRISYAQWAQQNSINPNMDGGIPRMERGAKPPKSPTGKDVKESVVYTSRPERLVIMSSPRLEVMELPDGTKYKYTIGVHNL